LGKPEGEVLKLLEKSPLTLAEIAERMNKKPKAVFRSLRKLFEAGKIRCDLKTRKYSISEDASPVKAEEKDLEVDQGKDDE